MIKKLAKRALVAAMPFIIKSAKKYWKNRKTRKITQ